MVADRMAGHRGGDRASMLAIDLLINQLLNSMHWFFQMDIDLEDREQGFIEDLKRMLQRVHEAIEQESSEEKGHSWHGNHADHGLRYLALDVRCPRRR